jgi:hypothetical protein
MQPVDSLSRMRQLNIRMPDEGIEILEQLSPTRKSWGLYLWQLLREERDREERRREDRKKDS